MKAILDTFSQLSKPNKSMVYLMWVYHVGSIVATTFVNIYVFKLQESYFDVLVFNLIVFASLAISFVFIGLIFSRLQKNVKNMYYIGYILLILCFSVFLMAPESLYVIFIHGLLYGMGLGVYWNAVHSQELKNISDEQRDFYSSSISAGSNLIGVIVPLGISLLFFLGSLYAFDGYMVLFFLIPCIYLSSVFFIKDIPSYIPKKISLVDIFSGIELKNRKFANLYLFFSGAKHSFIKAAIAVSAITLLNSEVNIGLFQGFLAFFSSYIVIHLGMKRKPGNRFQSFLMIGVLWAILHVCFAITFSLWSFILFSFSNLFLDPLFRSLAHTYDLHVMDNNKGNDFYATMLGREFILLASRMLSLLFLLSLLSFVSQDIVLRVSFALVGLFLLGEIISIYFWERYEKNK